MFSLHDAQNNYQLLKWATAGLNNYRCNNQRSIDKIQLATKHYFGVKVDVAGAERILSGLTEPTGLYDAEAKFVGIIATHIHMMVFRRTGYELKYRNTCEPDKL